MRIPLEPGDRVVAAVQHEGDVLVITEWGHVYRLRKDSDGIMCVGLPL